MSCLIVAIWGQPTWVIQVGMICWYPRSLILKFHKDPIWFGRDRGISIVTVIIENMKDMLALSLSLITILVFVLLSSSSLSKNLSNLVFYPIIICTKSLFWISTQMNTWKQEVLLYYVDMEIIMTIWHCHFDFNISFHLRGMHKSWNQPEFKKKSLFLYYFEITLAILWHYSDTTLTLLCHYFGINLTLL